MLPTYNAYGAWPYGERVLPCENTLDTGDEIDIMEHVGWQEAGLVHAAGSRFNPIPGEQRTSSKLSSDAHSVFHAHCLEWDRERLVILIDNEPSLTVENLNDRI